MRIKNNKLYFGKFRAEELARKFGTPLYVYEGEIIEKQYRKLVESINYPRLRIHYACKINTNIEVLQLLRRLGSGIETVSEGEVRIALKAGFRPKNIIYTSTSMIEKEMKFLVKNKIWVNLDSLHQIEMYGKLNPYSKVGIRVNQGIGAGSHKHLVTGGDLSKFGIPVEHLLRAKKLAQKYSLKITGLHQHIGTHVHEEKIMLEAYNKLFKTALDFPDLETLNFGGGFWLPYKPEDKNLNLKLLGGKLSDGMKKFCHKYGRELNMILEPGRFIVGESGTLLAEVADIKNNSKRNFIGLNTGMNHLVRPALYGAYHHITNASRNNGRRIKADIVGNICESGDVLGWDRVVTSPKIGDIFAIHTAGASGYAMASHYNSRPLPKEVFIYKNKVSN